MGSFMARVSLGGGSQAWRREGEGLLVAASGNVVGGLLDAGLAFGQFLQLIDHFGGFGLFPLHFASQPPGAVVDPQLQGAQHFEFRQLVDQFLVLLLAILLLLLLIFFLALLFNC